MYHWILLARRDPRTALRRLLTLSGLALGGVLLAFTPVLADDRPDGAELATAGAMLVVIVVFFIAGIIGIWWSWSNGEFEEPEEVKYAMMVLVEDEVDYWGMGTHDEEDEEIEQQAVHPPVLLPSPAE